MTSREPSNQPAQRVPVAGSPACFQEGRLPLYIHHYSEDAEQVQGRGSTQGSS
jgi:hypothetical protein